MCTRYTIRNTSTRYSAKPSHVRARSAVARTVHVFVAHAHAHAMIVHVYVILESTSTCEICCGEAVNARQTLLHAVLV